jgi:hypothetical protein
MAKSHSENGASQQTIEQLQQRYQVLNTRRIQAETNLENARKQLEGLKKEAREKYGTDEIGKLREQLEAMKAENERKRSEYESQLNQIEASLAAVEEKFSQSESGQEA